MLELKQLPANTSKSKYVIMAPQKSRTEAEANPIKLGETTIENSKSDKYLGDQIYKDGTAASIKETLNIRIPLANKRWKEILNNQPCLIGFHIATGPVEQFESREASTLLANAESRIGLNNTHVYRLQQVQDEFFTEMFQVSKKGTMNCMLWLDSQMLKMKWQIIQRKIRQVRKTMGKPITNLCKQALAS